MALLTALQHGDSFFPSGGVAFSQGVETLHVEGRLRGGEEVGRLLREQVFGRWAECDRAVLTAAHRAGDDLEAVAAADRVLEAATLPKELREGSCRAGAALLGVHCQLATRNAQAYQERIGRRTAPGHLAACQGLLWHSAGLSEAEATAAAAHVLCVGVLGAAIRLGALGAVEGQRLLTAMQAALADMLAQPPPALEALASYAPVVELAVLRHEEIDSRLFAN